MSIIERIRSHNSFKPKRSHWSVFNLFVGFFLFWMAITFSLIILSSGGGNLSPLDKNAIQAIANVTLRVGLAFAAMAFIMGIIWKIAGSKDKTTESLEGIQKTLDEIKEGMRQSRITRNISRRTLGK